jgi:ankyrin repeat protein
LLVQSTIETNFRGLEDITIKLLTAGADVNATDKYMNTPLHYAVISEEKKIIEILLKKPSLNFNKKNIDNKTAIELAQNEKILRVIDNCLNA